MLIHTLEKREKDNQKREEAQFSKSELNRLNRCGINRLRILIYLGLKLQDAEYGQLHIVRFIREMGIYRSTLFLALEVLRDKGFINFFEIPDSRNYKVTFLLEEENAIN